MVRLILKAEIKKYRRTLSKSRRTASYRKRFRLKYPHKVELQLRAILSALFRRTTRKVQEFIEGHYPRPIPKADGFATEFAFFMKELENSLKLGAVGGAIDLSPLVDRILEFMLKFKEEEIAEYMETLTGRPFYATTEWWAQVKRTWTNTLNQSMASNINAYVDKIRETVYNAVQNNKSLDFITAAIGQINSSLDEKKAAFIARDMTGKLNGEMERQLQMSVGIDGYFWQTMADERVRGRPGGVYANAPISHWLMESKVCKWSDVSVVSFDYGRTWVPRSANMPFKHPGGDWLCRCSGAPFSLSLLREIDRELEGERGTK
jgi:hypothetical protein